MSGIKAVPFRKAKAKKLLLNFKLPFVLRYPANGSASTSHCDLSYIEIYDVVMELGPLNGDIFPGEVIKQIHMDNFTGTGGCDG